MMPIEFRAAEQAEPRAIWRSIVRGLKGRCPNCGQGRLFQGYLTPLAACQVCGEDLSHQRSDDFGPYVTMVIVGHVVVTVVLFVMMNTTWSPWTILFVALLFTALLSIALLRPVKGAIIGLQWALRMHGFEGSANPDRPEPVVAYPPGVPPAAQRQPLPKSGLATK
jgi:uncharacterized protein (DUF983 family)